MKVHAIAFATVVIACHLLLVLVHFRNLWVYRPHYEFFPLLLLGIGWLMWKRWPRRSPAATFPLWSTVLLLVGAFLLAVATFFWSPLLAMIALIVSVAGLIARYAPPEQWRNWVPVWLLLWLTVPPPLGFDFWLITRLQSSTSLMASRVMDLLGILHLMEGNVLVLPGHRMLVDEACSGVNSVLVLLALTGLYVVAVRRPLIWAALLLASSIAWAWAGNTVRVTTIAIAQAWFDVDLTSGWQHEVLGYVTISLALAWLASTDYVLRFFLSPIRLKGLDLSDFAERSTPLTGAWNWLVGAGAKRRGAMDSTDQRSSASSEQGAENRGQKDALGPSARCTWYWIGAFGLMGTLQLAGLGVPMATRASGPQPERTALTATFPQTSLPESINGWDVVGYETEEREHGAPFGHYSTRWLLRSSTMECVVSVDQPFWGWHDLTVCCQGTGWELLDRRDLGDQGAEVGSGRFVDARLSKPTGEFGLLVFGIFDQEGNHLVPPLSDSRGPRLMGRLRSNLLTGRLLGKPPQEELRTVYQFQVFAPDTIDVHPEQRDKLRQLFFAAREKIVGSMNR